MEKWLDSPLIVVAGIAVISALVTIGIWVGRVNSDRDNFKHFMQEVRDDIKKILARLPAPSIEHGSPLRLTKIGKRITEQLDGKIWARKIAGRIAAEAKGRPNYEVQELCFDFVRKRFVPTEQQDSEIKQAAYDMGIDYDAVLDVLAVELRDALLESIQQPEPTAIPQP